MKEGPSYRQFRAKKVLETAKKEEKKTQTSWGGVADWYDGLLAGQDTYQQAVILPNLMRIVDPKPGMRVLDLACGQGFFSREFRNRGAEVFASDISPELIALARKAGERGISYHVSPADKISFLKDDSVDAATIVLAMQNIENLTGTVKEVLRVLKSGGKFVLVLNHPSFRIIKSSEWGFDDKKGIQYRRLDRYMSESREDVEMNPGKKDGKKTVSFHRPLQSYFKALSKYGFSVSRLEEWISHKESGPGTRQAAENRARKEFPMFMMVEARKG